MSIAKFNQKNAWLSLNNINTPSVVLKQLSLNNLCEINSFFGSKKSNILLEYFSWLAVKTIISNPSS